MKDAQFFRRSPRHAFRNVELSLHIDVVRALKRLAIEHEMRPKQFCEFVLAIYADTVFRGKSLGQFRDWTRAKSAKPVFAPVRDAEELLVEEMAEAIKRGESVRRKYPRQTILLARAYALLKDQEQRAKRPARRTI